ncbi:NAD(P)/FAD-dependent oxidoreductase [Deferrisoma camini]|uniref:NAD(P)/FAD-dependent oxidoreductase n=1 Tax=Deferrisoma camini TaxID=1035120 RepID=UPI0004A4489D|nr:FAD-dependent oxidoreductase [Deferrisoma camini]
MKVVTVGAGVAAAEFVETLRAEGFRGEIVMISAEGFPPYSPCVMPFFLAGDPLETAYWKGADFYDRLGVTPRLGDPVTEVEDGKVRTASGAVETFDRLLYAPGARDRYPEPSWLRVRGVFGFKTLSDLTAIDRHIRETGARRAVIFGGGFIGVDAALALWHRGLQVTVVHRNNRLLSRMTDEDGGKFATRLLAERTGIEVRLETRVTAVNARDGALASVDLTDGTRIETPLLIVATGVAPESGPLTGADQGVAVDEALRFDPRVYAAGDVAVTPHAVDGRPGLYALFPNAVEQARVAARHLVHGRGAYAGSVDANVLRKHVDFPVVSAGRFEGEPLTWQDADRFRRVYLKDGRINGYMLVGDMAAAGYLHRLYLEQTPAEREVPGLLSDTSGTSYYRRAVGLGGR